jgi:hypothetical protein
MVPSDSTLPAIAARCADAIWILNRTNKENTSAFNLTEALEIGAKIAGFSS